MEAEGDSETAHGKKGQQEGEVYPSHVRVPQKDDGGDDPEDGKPNESQKDQLGKGCCCLGMRYGRRHLTRLLDISARASSRKRFLKYVSAKNTEWMAGRKLKKRFEGGLSPRPSWGVAHDGEEKNEFEGINEHEDN
jgi:hypothetical protein